MKTTLPFTLLAVLALAGAASPVHAQKKQGGATYLTVAEADADYALQGEYTGKVGDAKLGLQVVALGDGKFMAVVCHGGLPGDGWDVVRPRERVEATRDGDKVVFAGKKWKGSLEGGKIAVTVGGDSGTLERVERKSPTLGKKAPEGAIVLFDGKNADAWQGGKMTEDGLLMQGTHSKQEFGDHTLHIEFLLPYKPHARGQGRGNSGLYVQARYETQMLDSFGLTGETNECGGIYKIAKPKENMCYPPLQWQTYDVDFTAAKYDASGKKTANARMTVRHNGVVIHDDQELPKATTASKKKDGPDPGPIYLQNHGNPVRYRNIWVVEKG